MIRLRPMNENEFQDLVKKNQKSYLDDLEKYDKHFRNELHISAREFGEKQLKDLIKDGLNASDQLFFVVNDVNSNQDIGILWLMEKSKQKILFIADIFLEKKFRGKGFGTAILNKVDDIAKNKYNYDKIGLHVFKHNPRAKNLYKRVGFTIAHEDFSGFTMIKHIHTN